MEDLLVTQGRKRCFANHDGYNHRHLVDDVPEAYLIKLS